MAGQKIFLATDRQRVELDKALMAHGAVSYHTGLALVFLGLFFLNKATHNVFAATLQFPTNRNAHSAEQFANNHSQEIDQVLVKAQGSCCSGKLWPFSFFFHLRNFFS